MRVDTDGPVTSAAPGAPLVLNLGCGTRTSDACVNIDWSPILRLRASRVGRAVGPWLVGHDRRAKFRSVSERTLVHDLRKGIPFADGTVDVAYSSHVLEHVDRDAVGGFLAEIRRALAPGGVVRIVVPDFAVATARYRESLERARRGEVGPDDHDESIAEVILQMVRREAFGTSQQGRWRRLVENAVLGDARRRGELHRWMYDDVTLPAALRRAGFVDVEVVDHRTSRVDRWSSYGLDTNPDGTEYIPGSLYVEASRPR